MRFLLVSVLCLALFGQAFSLRYAQGYTGFAGQQYNQGAMAQSKQSAEASASESSESSSSDYAANAGYAANSGYAANAAYGVGGYGIGGPLIAHRRRFARFAGSSSSSSLDY